MSPSSSSSSSSAFFSSSDGASSATPPQAEAADEPYVPDFVRQGRRPSASYNSDYTGFFSSSTASCRHSLRAAAGNASASAGGTLPGPRWRVVSRSGSSTDSGPVFGVEQEPGGRKKGKPSALVIPATFGDQDGTARRSRKSTRRRKPHRRGRGVSSGAHPRTDLRHPRAVVVDTGTHRPRDSLQPRDGGAPPGPVTQEQRRRRRLVTRRTGTGTDRPGTVTHPRRADDEAARRRRKRRRKRRLVVNDEGMGAVPIDLQWTSYYNRSKYSRSRARSRAGAYSSPGGSRRSSAVRSQSSGGRRLTTVGFRCLRL